MIERMICKAEGFAFGVLFTVTGALVYARYMDIQKREQKEAESEEGGGATLYANEKVFNINGCDGD